MIHHHDPVRDVGRNNLSAQVIDRVLLARRALRNLRCTGVAACKKRRAGTDSLRDRYARLPLVYNQWTDHMKTGSAAVFTSVFSGSLSP